jgi:ornithine cyclodeaminase/alanine dehydrogenase-like protein (mu-crystallin family)
MAPAFPDVAFRKVTTAEAAVRGADVVVTAAPIVRDPKPTVRPGWLNPGTFASAVDFDCYWTRDAVEQMDLVFTDDHSQFQYYRSIGYLPTLEQAHGELADLVTGKKPGRTDPGQRTMAMFLGLAIEDMVTGVRILERARRLGIGTKLPL